MATSNSITVALTVVFIFLIYVAAVLVIYFTTFYNSDHIPYDKANAPLGEFALEPSSQSQNIKKLCGSDRNKSCVKQVNNLEEATNYCNLYSEICDRFMYNDTTKTVSIVDLKGTITKNPNTNLFTRQVGVTYNSSGLNKEEAYDIPGLEYVNFESTNLVSTNMSTSMATY